MSTTQLAESARVTTSPSACFAIKKKFPPEEENVKLEENKEQQELPAEVAEDTKIEPEDQYTHRHNKRQKVDEAADQKSVKIATVGTLPPAHVAEELKTSETATAESAAPSSSFVLKLSGTYKKATSRDADIFGKSNWTNKHFVNCPCCE